MSADLIKQTASLVALILVIGMIFGIVYKSREREECLHFSSGPQQFEECMK